MEASRFLSIQLHLLLIYNELMGQLQLMFIDRPTL